jgi:hypothetical protein
MASLRRKDVGMEVGLVLQFHVLSEPTTVALSVTSCILEIVTYLTNCLAYIVRSKGKTELICRAYYRDLHMSSLV